MTRPISASMPIWANIVSVMPDIDSAAKAPTNDKGAVSMMMVGWEKLLNWLARIM